MRLPKAPVPNPPENEEEGPGCPLPPPVVSKDPAAPHPVRVRIPPSPPQGKNGPVGSLTQLSGQDADLQKSERRSSLGHPVASPASNTHWGQSPGLRKESGSSQALWQHLLARSRTPATTLAAGPDLHVLERSTRQCPESTPLPMAL